MLKVVDVSGPCLYGLYFARDTLIDNPEQPQVSESRIKSKIRILIVESWIYVQFH